MTTIAELTDGTFVHPVERFFQQPGIYDSLAFLASRLPPTADIFVAGGALRNLVIDAMHGNAPTTRDIDIFIGGPDHDFPLVGVLHDQRTDQTDLKGLRWFPVSSDLAFDLSLLVDFVVIDSVHLDPTMENLLAGIDFTINAIVYDYRQRRLVEKGCTAAVRERTIDFNSRHIPNRHLIAYRILLMGHKTGFTLSEPVFIFIRKRLELAALTHLKKLFRAKFGRTMAGIIMNEYDQLCKHPSYDAYLATRAGFL